MIPLIKFVGSKEVLGEFALPKHYQWIGSIFGVIVIMLNFIQIFLDSDLCTLSIIITGIIFAVYLWFILRIMRQPVSRLKKITKDANQNESYERIVIIDTDRSSSVNGD